MLCIVVLPPSPYRIVPVLQPSALVRTCYHSTGTALREIPGGDVDGTGPTRTGTEVDDSEKGFLYIYS